MTVKDEIRTFLSNSDLTLKELQRKICIRGHNFNTMKSTIGRMLRIGEIINIGSYKRPVYTLNKDFVPVVKKVKPEAPVAVVHKKTRPPIIPQPEQPKSENVIFNLCRKHSRIRKYIDIPLQAVRA